MGSLVKRCAPLETPPSVCFFHLTDHVHFLLNLSMPTVESQDGYVLQYKRWESLGNSKCAPHFT